MNRARARALMCLPFFIFSALAAEPTGRAAALLDQPAAEPPVDRMDQPLTSTPGDPVRGRQLFAARDGGHCILCHSGAESGPNGNVGPSLTGVGARLTAPQLRFRIVDITRLNPDAVMPAFYRTKNLERVAKDRVGVPLLDAQQVEDIVAYLATLK